jgi:hypothetical protein
VGWRWVTRIDLMVIPAGPLHAWSHGHHNIEIFQSEMEGNRLNTLAYYLNVKDFTIGLGLGWGGVGVSKWLEHPLKYCMLAV